MALSLTEFEKKIVSETLVPTRNQAARVSRYIRANVQGRSAEAFTALIPGLMNEALAPSFSIAKLIMIYAQEWLGE